MTLSRRSRCRHLPVGFPHVTVQWTLRVIGISPFVPAANYSCGGFLTQFSGNFSSPFYPRNYPNNAKCVWDIEVQNNYRATVVFRDVQ